MGAAVVACGDTAPVFKFAEAVFNDVSFFIKVFIVFVLGFTIFLGRDAGHDPFFLQGCAEPICIIPTVGEQFFGLWHFINQGARPFVIAGLSCSQLQQNRSSSTVGDSMQL